MADWQAETERMLIASPRNSKYINNALLSGIDFDDTQMNFTGMELFHEQKFNENTTSVGVLVKMGLRGKPQTNDFPDFYRPFKFDHP